MNKKFIAFTLIELLVVIAIIGILSGLIIVGMNGMTDSANIAKSQVFSNSLRNSLMMNLVSEWKLDQVLGSSAPYTTPDSWSGGNTGTLMNGASNACSFTVPLSCPQPVTSGCPSGKCLSFDGTDDYLNCGNSNNMALTQEITLEAWIKQSSATAYGGIISKSDNGSQNSYGLIIMSDTNYDFHFFVYNAASCPGWSCPGALTSLNDNIQIANNKWYHIVAIYKYNTNTTSYMGLYLDGKLIDFLNTAVGPIAISSQNVLIGSWAGNMFNGLIDDVRIYNAAMPISQIKEQYYAGLNSLLTNGQINAEEYNQRINSIAKE